MKCVTQITLRWFCEVTWDGYIFLSLNPTADDAVSVEHDVHGVAGHVGHDDAQPLIVSVPQPDVVRAGCKPLRCSTRNNRDRWNYISLRLLLQVNQPSGYIVRNQSYHLTMYL